MNRFMSVLSAVALLLWATSSISAQQELTGTITETMNTGGYTYLQLDGTSGSVWVAIPETAVTKGATVTCLPGMEMQNFESKTLKRSFASIFFSPGLANAQELPAKAQQPVSEQQQPQGTSFSEALQAEQKAHASAPGGPVLTEQSPGSLGAIVPSKDIHIEKAEGANSYTVGECYAKADELNNSQVTVRGKVVKVSTMIMGRNWIHLQDGTGNPLQNSHDLVVTTQATPVEGNVATFSGTLHANRDFGAGYKYAVIIEEATLQ